MNHLYFWFNRFIQIYPNIFIGTVNERRFSQMSFFENLALISCIFRLRKTYSEGTNCIRQTSWYIQ